MVSIILPGIMSGLATGLVFVPLSTMAMGTLTNDQIGNASGMFNLMRNTGGSLGIAAVTTMLARGAQSHQAAMASHLTVYDPAFQQRMHDITGTASVQPSSAASRQTSGSIYGSFVRHVSVMSYVDNLRLLAFFCVICIPLVFLFKRVKRSKAPVSMH
jgi:DHA2 family multidrug resistance protein